MGIVISPENEDDIRIPDQNIISSEIDVTIKGTKLKINLVGGQYINLIAIDRERFTIINNVINDNAGGVEEEGWY